MPSPALTLKAQETITDLGGEQTALEKEARTSFPVFYQLVAPTIADLADVPIHELLKKHHWDLIDLLCTGESNRRLKLVAGPNSVALMPRGCGKSFIIKYWVAWVIGNNPTIRIMFLSSVEGNAGSFSMDIQRIIQNNEVYRKVFPEVRPGSPWNQLKWQIDVKGATGKNPSVDYTMLAFGLNSAISSKRSDLIIGDDIVTSDKDVDTEEKRKSRENNWYQCIEPTLVNGGRIVVPGTRYHPLDEFATIFTEENGYKVIRQKAIVQDESGREKSFWEKMFPYKDGQNSLCAKRKKKPSAFMFQYQNEAIVETSESFNADWIKYKRMLPIEEYAVLGIGVDLASALGKKADYTAMILGGSTYDGEYHIIDYIHGRWMGNAEKNEQVALLLEENGIIEWNFDLPDTPEYHMKNGRYLMTDNTCYLIPEKVAYQESFRGDFKATFEDELELWNVRDHLMRSVKRAKAARFMGITGAFENGKVFLNENIDWGLLTSEMIGFGFTEHDDMADALVHLLKFLFVRKPFEVT